MGRARRTADGLRAWYFLVSVWCYGKEREREGEGERREGGREGTDWPEHVRGADLDMGSVGGRKAEAEAF